MKTTITTITTITALLALAGCAHAPPSVCSPSLISFEHQCSRDGQPEAICCSSNQTQEQCEAGAARFAAEHEGCR